MNVRRLQIAFIGDMCLSFLRDPGSRAHGFSKEWMDIENELGEYDLLVGNLECFLADSRCSEKVQDCAMAVPAAAAGSFLNPVKPSALCLANNHSVDGGTEGINTTLEHLSSMGIPTFGVGANLSEAEKTSFVESKGCKIAFIGACDKSEYYATADGYGIAPMMKRRLGRRIRDATSQADLVIVVLHADLEFSEVPGRWRRRLSRWLVDQGAHAVIQHHPHVLQGIEFHKGKLIAYSLGNFVFRIQGNRYQERRPGVKDSVVLVADVQFCNTTTEIAYRVVPIRIGENHLPRPVTGPAQVHAMQEIHRLSSILTDERSYRRAWFLRCKAEAIIRVRSACYAFAKGQFARGALEAWNLFARREDRRWIIGLLSFGYI